MLLLNIISNNKLTVVVFPFEPVMAMIWELVNQLANSISLTILILCLEAFLIIDMSCGTPGETTHKSALNIFSLCPPNSVSIP